MKGILRPSAEFLRLGEHRDELLKLDDRPRPAMREHERQRVGMRRAHMDEVQREPVDVRGELRQFV